MNTEDLEKLYKESKNHTAPDFWDRIDAGLKPHSELTEEDKNSLTEFEEDPVEIILYDAEEPAAAQTGAPFLGQIPAQSPGQSPAQSPEKVIPIPKAPRRRRNPIGWIAAAVAAIICIPTMFLLTKNIVGKGASKFAHAEIAAATEAPMEEAAGMDPSVPEAAAEAAAETAAQAFTEAAGTYASLAGDDEAEYDVEAEYDAETEHNAEYDAQPRTIQTAALLSVPEGAVTSPSDTVLFTEDVLAQTDLLAIVQIESAEFEYSKEGYAYRLSYSGTVTESLLEDDESGKTGSALRIVSPIVSDGIPGGTVLYQLVPGQTYILPLRKSGGDWELVCPYAPQITVREDGSFEFHTGYASLLDGNTEVVYDTKASDDDFWFDRKVYRCDSAFKDELTDLVRFEKLKAWAE